jgi:tRNA(His) 5'-end guanylyltransferase
MKDALGDRMKANYESRTRQFLMRRNYTVIRIDGKAFHTYTKHLQSPFDDNLMHDMDSTAAILCKEIGGAKFAFVQSDEISLLITDFDDLQTQAWFDYNVQKMVSVSASVATAAFNQFRQRRETNDVWGMKLAHFDSRVFQLPNKSEVENYFIWRQQDTTRNSILSVAQSLYSHKQLEGKNTSELQEMIFQKGINWNDYKPYYKRGRMIMKEEYEIEPNPSIPEAIIQLAPPTLRTRWVMKEVPIFTQEREFISNLIPDNL